MYRLDIVWVAFSPRSAHTLWPFMVGHYIVVISKFFKTDGTDPVLLNNIPIEWFPLSRRAKLSIPTRMMRVFDSLHSQPEPGAGLRRRRRLAGPSSERRMRRKPPKALQKDTLISRSGTLRTRKSNLFFHNSIHRYFVSTPIIALTSMRQLFSFACVDG